MRCMGEEGIGLLGEMPCRTATTIACSDCDGKTSND